MHAINRLINYLHQANWTLTHTAANHVENPIALNKQNLDWLPASVPGTIAQSLRLVAQEKSQLAMESDNYDWWYQCEFSAPENISLPESSNKYFLNFDGLATLAEVWLNNELILSAQNMFVPHSLDVTEKLFAQNRLVICFRSAANFLQQKRPRPQWKTNLVNHQQLRWLRTTLLGRIPGWCPAITPIGPWRDISLQEHKGLQLISSKITNVLNSDFSFDAEFTFQLPQLFSERTQAQLIVGEHGFELSSAKQDNFIRFTGSGKISANECWWPHTHGLPNLLPTKLVVSYKETKTVFDLGLRGFKQLQLNRNDGLVEIQINQQSIYCRGACWTIADIETLVGTEKSLRRSLELARDAGMNMLRIGGTMVYESDEFYKLCDELGIMVWQDFMFANMDYPTDDANFSESINTEVKAQLNRLLKHVCISVYCGNSEVQQQSAMMGQTREHWSNSFFDTDLKNLSAQFHSGIPYFPSTPSEGVLPFSVSEGISHYYGVGAYKRPLQDAVTAQIKFTPETLGFSNIPEPNTVDEVLGGSNFTAHDPAWKKTIPRDSSAGWDFEDVRDFYLGKLFKLDSVQLRSHDPQRYLELSRVVTGELMLRTIANWRAASHPCRGALLWFYKDLIPGGGWGLLDSNNQPKAAYFGVKRANATLGVYFLDKGLDGLYLSLINETRQERNIKLTIKAFNNNHIETLSFSKNISLGQISIELSINELLGYFTDLNYSYGFGPKQQDVVCASIEDDVTGEWLHDDYYFVGDYNFTQQTTKNIQIDVVTDDDQNNYLHITSDLFLQFLRIDINGYDLSDNYFHLAPNMLRVIKLTSKNEIPIKIKGSLESINLISSFRFSQ